MAECVECGKETTLHIGSLPVCDTCDGTPAFRECILKRLENVSYGSFTVEFVRAWNVLSSFETTA